MGFLLVTIGILFLLKNFGFIAGDVWDILWPMLLIAAGVNLILRKRYPGFFWEERFGWGRKTPDEKSPME